MVGGGSNANATRTPYACKPNRDYRAPCIRAEGVGCPFREIRTPSDCASLCDEYESLCLTFVHNRYGECYLRTGHSGAGEPDQPRHRTISCRKQTPAL